MLLDKAFDGIKKALNFQNSTFAFDFSILPHLELASFYAIIQ